MGNKSPLKVADAMKSLGKIILVLLLSIHMLEEVSIAKSGTDERIRVMTYNLRYLNEIDPSPHTWEERRRLVRKVIQSEKPDILATQEPFFPQVKDVAEDFPEYDWIGLGQEGGSKGSFFAIFYDAKRFKPLEYDYFWLSDTPELIGSATWGNTIPRMVAWAKFLDTRTNRPFYFMNTHLDHLSERSRQKSVSLILKRLGEFEADIPVVLAGDFNAGPDSAIHQMLVEKGPFQDVWESSQEKVNEDLGTINSFRYPKGGGPDKRIDWILMKGNVTANEVKINDYREGSQFPSDHYPVVADLTIDSTVMKMK